jgi:ribokinase
MQLEVPLDVNAAAANAAAEHSIRVILDPAPAVELPNDIYPLIDIITPNETETEILTGITVTDEDSAGRAARDLIGRGVSQVIVKMGARGAYWTDGSDEDFFPALSVATVDTVAAGDAFNGGLGVALQEGMATPDAIRFATRVAALSTTKHGAQDAMPTRADVDAPS